MNPLPQAFFDNYALAYDEHFTESAVGLAQRDMVHDYMKNVLSSRKTILEINCGTGVDAFFLSQRCKSITCTDISPRMIETTKLKLGGFANCCAIESSVQNLKNIIESKSDIIFSNFGGLNCLSEKELEAFAEDCAILSGAESELIFVIMGKKCLWERLYFICKGNFKKAYRRTKKNGVAVGSGTEEFRVYYYSPVQLRKIFLKHFEVKHCEAIGLFIPPSYLNPYFAKRPYLFSLFRKLDRVFRRFSFMANYADHYLIHLKRK